jgi:hypothetical protein
MSSELLNKKRLAEAMGHSPTYVSAMIKCGYVMKFGSRTTLKHAHAWLADRASSGRPFRVAEAYPALAVPKSARPRKTRDRQPEAACKSNESQN